MIKHDLIEQVGGIEKARAIVEGAPEGATDYRKLSCTTRYVKVGERYAEWWNGEKWCRFAEPFTDENNILRCKPLNDLRTAIAQYNPNPSNSRELESDDVKDIRNHISPSTKVVEA